MFKGGRGYNQAHYRLAQAWHAYVGGGCDNITTKDEEKTEVLHTFFAPVFNSQISYSQGIQPPVLEDSDGEQNNPPQSSRKQLMACCAPGPTQVYGAGWD